MTASTRTGRRLRWSPAGRLLAVVTLALAVIGMHSMGAGHSDLMVDGAQVMTQHVGTSSHRGASMAPPAARATGSTTSPAAAPPPRHARPRPCSAYSGSAYSGSACAGTACSGVDLAGHSAGDDMTAMCLAVLPGLLLLLLLLTWLLLGRGPSAVVVGTGWRLLTSPIRAGPPPPHLTPSLSKLCILRT